jgi:hypothetical protein
MHVFLFNAVNPIVFESVMMAALSHNYKALLEIDKEGKKEDNENVTKDEIKLQKENEPQGKILFDRAYKKWQGLTGALHNEDREPLLKMLLETCNHNGVVIG